MLGSSAIRVGVLGYGYWGPSLARAFGAIPGCELAAVSDLFEERLTLARSRHPDARVTSDWREIVADPRIDAIAVATPVVTHFDLAAAALRAGKHVLVEKPLASSSAESLALMDESARRRLVLMVDHTFVFSGAVRKIRELVADGTLGDLYYYDSVRINLGLVRPDVNVIWDLAAHDLAILDYALPVRPTGILAFGRSHVPGGRESIAYLTVFFGDSFMAHVHVNWLAPTKVRRTLIGGSRRMLVYDDLEPREKVTVHDKGIDALSPDGPAAGSGARWGYRVGDVWVPDLDRVEPLRGSVAHFLACIEASARPVTDGAAGLRVVRLLEAASRSLRAGGRRVEIEPERVPA